MKKIISILVGASLLPSGGIPNAKADEAAASLSGYVSNVKLENSIAIADETGNAKIYVDDLNDFEGVRMAAGSLAGDIDSVTDTKSEIIGTMSGAASITDVVFGDGTVKAYVKNISLLTDTGRGIIAVYHNDGTLKGVSFSKEDTSQSTGVINFDTDFSYNPENEHYKAFLWKSTGDRIEPVPLTTGKVTDANIIVGTIGRSEAVDTLIAEGKLDVSGIQDKWESFVVQAVDNSIVIAGSDKRGTIYGIYDLSEKIGVSPWNWWADVVPAKCSALYANLDTPYTEGEPSVKYRGIFINDELNLNKWSESMGDGPMNEETYEKVFELLLRLKANLLWPAMHPYSPAFNNNENNPKNADKYGIIVGSSHCDILLRNNMGEIKEFQEQWIAENPDKPLYTEWNGDIEYATAYNYTDKDKSGNTVYNKEFLEAYWRDGVRKNKDYESIYTLGMRGVHDGSFSSLIASTLDEKTALMQEIITLQRRILSEELGRDIKEIPQLFIPYKDVLEIYNNGLEVPEDITLMWPDDNFGYIRQNAGEAEQLRTGGNGIYYHLSYYGNPISYLWLTSTQPGLIREEMVKAYENGAKQFWVVNVGDIKPAETDIEYFLDLARNIDTMRETDITEYLVQNARRDFGFGNEDAMEYADIQKEFYELANSKRPEHMRQGVFSITDYGDEGQKYVDAYKTLTERSEALYNRLPENKKAAFFELQLYPLRASYNLAADYVYTDKAQMYYEQGRGLSANKYANAAARAADVIDEDTVFYNTMLDGKWDKIMSLSAAELPWASQLKPWVETRLNPPSVTALDFTDMGIAVEGQKDISSEPYMGFSSVSKQYRFIDIFNTGYGSFDWSASSENGLVVFNENGGTVNDEHRIYVSVNWDKLNSKEVQDKIIICASIGGNVFKEIEIPVAIKNPSVEIKDGAYIEADGYVSIEAEHYTDSVKNGEYEWRIEKDFGRSGDSLKIYPDKAANISAPNAENSAYTEYEVYFENAGTYPIDVYRMPTLNETGSEGFAIGVGNSAPSILWGNNKTLTSKWNSSAVTNTDIVSSTIKVQQGYNTIRLYNRDCGVVIDKMVITTNGDKRRSYFGAPESYNSRYNNTAPVLPQPSAPSENEEEVTKLSEPKLITIAADIDNGVLNNITVAKVNEYSTTAVCAAALYDEDGSLITVKYADIDLTDTAVNDTLTVPFGLEMTPATELSVIIFNGFDELYALSPVWNSKLTDSGIKPVPECDTVTLKSDLSDYTGRQALVLISKSGSDISNAENTAYIKQETIKGDMYKSVPFNAEQGEYDVKIGVPYIKTFTEQFNNIINVDTDNDGTETELYSWTFDTDEEIGSDGDTDIPVLSGDALYNEENKMIQVSDTQNTGGTAQINFSKPATAFQGCKLIVKFDVYYGSQSKKYMNYKIYDSSGNELVYSHICGYGSVTDQTIAICGENKLTNTTWPSFLTSANPSTKAGAVTYTHEFDFDKGTIRITASSKKGTETLEGVIDSSYTDDISKIMFYSYHTYTDRACFVDNISLTQQTGPQYAMMINPVDENGDTIDNAKITVTERGKEIASDNQGRFMLCKGNYDIRISADGYRVLEDVIEVGPSMTSKDIVYVLQESEPDNSLYTED